MYYKNKIYNSDLLSIYLYFLFLVSSYIYCYYFSIGNVLNYEPIEGFINPVNTHDHYIYSLYVKDIMHGDIEFVLNNNIGISYIYIFLISFSELFFDNVNLELLSLVFNLIIILFSYLTYRTIIIDLGLDPKLSLTFFMFSFLIYFAQLINKDSLTILISLRCVLYSYRCCYIKLFILILFSFFVRFQLPALILLYLVLININQNNLLKLGFIYVSLSLCNGFLVKYQSTFLSEETIGGGLSYLVYSLNEKYYIGSLLLNPLRIAQYFYDYYLSFWFVVDGKIDISRLKNIPHILYFTFLLPYLFLAYKKYSLGSLDFKSKCLLSMGVSFFLIWLFNPTINSRYFICFLPILQLIALNQREISNKLKE